MAKVPLTPRIRSSLFLYQNLAWGGVLSKYLSNERTLPNHELTEG